jgi:hypothetical protein
MRACRRCSYDNADHLVYCFSCGRRIDPRPPAVPPTGVLPTALPTTPSPARKAVLESGLASEPVPDGFATTMAQSKARDHTTGSQRAIVRPNILVRGLDCLRYVFTYVRGRIDAEDQRRALIEELDGARRLSQGAYFELGQIVLEQAATARELAGPIEAAKLAEVRRTTAIADLAAAEKFQASDDLRLGMEQASAENELQACERGAAELDKTLRQIEGELRENDAALGRGNNDPSRTSTDRNDTDPAALRLKRADLEEQYGSQRERAAALRASTIAARAKMDQTIVARRQAATAMAASIVGHARARSDAEASIRELVMEIGRVATEIRFPLPALSPGYARASRLEQTIADRERQIAGIGRMVNEYNPSKLAAGLGLLSAILCVLGASLWALLR